MKNILKLLALFALTTSCKAQNQIIDIQNDNGDEITGAYYKDIQNILDPFIGTYIYTDGTTSLKIVLQKKLMSSHSNLRYYEDLIVGEYQYIKDGVEIANTLNRLNINKPDGSNYSICGNNIITKTSGICPDCTPNEKALFLGFVDDLTDNLTDSFIVRRVVEDGQPAIKIMILWAISGHLKGTPSSQKPNIPGGYYILIKQP
ncbi:MAG: hypothetical protein LCH35_05015 [Bacteroidetes bacterium]|uniref:DUF6705 family protein n=1 Tax=Flavobacterium sp. TaxID=239 RepID=UPI002FD9C610|nr:hypothetical protein [Bacteroidota bacterium]